MLPESTTLQKVSFGVIVGLAAVALLAIVPVTDNFIITTKQYTILFGTIVLLALFVIHTFKRRALEFVLSPLLTPLLLFAGAVAASTFFTNAYPVEGLLGFGGTYLGFAVVAILAGSLLPRTSASAIVTSLGITAAVLAFLSILQQFGFGPAQLLNLTLGLELPTSQLFNVTGSALVALQVLLIVATGFIGQLKTNKSLSKSTAILLPIIVIGVAFFTWTLLPGQPANPRLPSYAASWSVALDTVRSPRSALIGVGPASYGNVYSQFKPLWVNGTDSWAIQFVQGANTPLTHVTTLGFLGLATWIFLIIRIVKEISRSNTASRPLGWMLTASIVLQLLLPPNPVIIFLQALIIGAFIASEKGHYPVVQLRALAAHILNHQQASPEQPARRSHAPAYVLGGLGLVLVVGLTYMVGRAYAAHYHMGQAEHAFLKNDGIAVYNHHQQAVTLNPYVDYFRRSYAITNFQIAAVLSEKADASETEQQQAAELIQQAIREARSATILDPSDYQNWQVLAEIYRSLIGTAEEADQWAIQAFVQAIETNPTDPTLRVALGGVFAAQNSASQAAVFYEQAVNLKPDFANGYYNLAVSLQALGNLEQAKLVYQTLLTLLPENSDDFVQITSELEALEKMIDEYKAQIGEQQGEQSATTPAPSLLDQNLESSQSVVNNPSNKPIELDSLTPAPIENTPATE